MRDFSLTIDGSRYRAKNLDDHFADFIESDLAGAGIHFERNNSAEQLFSAYLRLASRWYHYEKEIDEILQDVEKV